MRDLVEALIAYEKGERSTQELENAVRIAIAKGRAVRPLMKNSWGLHVMMITDLTSGPWHTVNRTTDRLIDSASDPLKAELLSDCAYDVVVR
jgi:hypothetical protein